MNTAAVAADPATAAASETKPPSIQLRTERFAVIAPSFRRPLVYRRAARMLNCQAGGLHVN
ncbi:MAG: hypothetical protein ACRDH5_13145 [bacterium]